MIQGFLLSSDYNFVYSKIILLPNDYCWIIDKNNNARFIKLSYDDKEEYCLSAYEITYTDEYYKKEKIDNFINKMRKGHLKFVCSDTNNNSEHSYKKEKWEFEKLPNSKLLFIERKNNLSNNLKILNNVREILFFKKWTKETLSNCDITDAINLAIYEFDNK